MVKKIMGLLKKLRLPKVNKKGNLVGCVLCMILVILASQSRAFDFFIESNLGRMSLVALVLTICYTSKVFGVASVLFLFLAFAVQMKSREGMCSKKCKKCGDKPCSCEKEGMCSKKKEAFGNLMKKDRIMQERDLQQGKLSNNERTTKSGSGSAKPHDNLESEYGSAY